MELPSQPGDPAAATAASPRSRPGPEPLGSCRSRPRLGPAILGRQSLHALKALMLLAEEPQRWLSVADLAARQQLPQALLEQQLLQLRRAGLLQARRGRSGGYRLAMPPQTIDLAAVLEALRPHSWAALAQTDGAADPPNPQQAAADRVAALLERRLWRTLEQELHSCTLADLLHDLRSARALLGEEGGWLLG
ncbi:MAG: RrF2 family transcriptional regulator [Cyanobium sp.]|jgi:Rrf2 family iron-sulfur cluster assembly transcriptional regulator|nr:Rrf2 family transcriptional regulator [Synechococcaceae cyanobacterium]